MSNMPAVDKRKVSLQLRISTIKKIDVMAEMMKLSRNSVANSILDEGVDHIKLTDEQKKEVRDEIERNKRNR